MSEAKKNIGVRLSEKQISGLKAAAVKLSKRIKTKIGYTTLAGMAVDEFLGSGKRSNKTVA